jgi:hypothetical protein
MTAAFATLPEMSRGRLFPEEGSAHRSCFQRDRDRIIHSSAFRRLKHKTQVFVEHEGDYYRTRLTHSVEVAQVARTIARVLGLNEELAEAVALAHDLGHPPFGHTGEEALQALMAGHGGFDHDRDPARGALCRLRRAEPDLGDPRGHRQAQRAGRRRRAVRARRLRRAARPRARDARQRRGAGGGDLRRHRLQQPRPRRRAPGRAVHARGPAAAAADRPLRRRGGRALAGARAGAARARGVAAVLRPLGRGRAGDQPGADRGGRAPERRRHPPARTAGDPLLGRDLRRAEADPPLPARADVPALGGSRSLRPPRS